MLIDGNNKSPRGMFMCFGTPNALDRGTRIGRSFKTEVAAIKAAWRFVRQSKARFIRVEHRSRGLIHIVGR